MKAAYSIAPEIADKTVWCLDKIAYKFCGTPSHCLAQLTFINHSPDKVKIREITASISDKKSKLVLLSNSITCRAKLLPNSRLGVLAKLAVAPQTPPGDYAITLHIGNQCYPAQVQIIAEDNLQIQPSRLYLEGASGDTVSQCVTLHNLGNLPVSLQDLSLVWFEEKNWGGHTLVQTLRDTPADADYTGYLNQLLKNFQDGLIAPVKVEFSPKEPEQLAPGQCVEKTITLTLPAGLKKGKTYHGFIKIRSLRIWLALYCNGSPNSSIRR